MRKILFGVFTLIAAVAVAQVKPTDKFEWSVPASSLTEAQAYRYEIELDGSILTNPLITTCSGSTSPYLCEANIPPVTPSSHTVRLRAVDITGDPLPAEWSDPFTFTMRAIPGKITNIRIKSGS